MKTQFCSSQFKSSWQTKTITRTHTYMRDKISTTRRRRWRELQIWTCNNKMCQMSFAVHFVWASDELIFLIIIISFRFVSCLHYFYHHFTHTHTSTYVSVVIVVVVRQIEPSESLFCFEKCCVGCRSWAGEHSSRTHSSATLIMMMMICRRIFVCPLFCGKIV